jgi:hypothetical protein
LIESLPSRNHNPTGCHVVYRRRRYTDTVKPGTCSILALTIYRSEMEGWWWKSCIVTQHKLGIPKKQEAALTALGFSIQSVWKEWLKIPCALERTTSVGSGKCFKSPCAHTRPMWHTSLPYVTWLYELDHYIPSTSCVVTISKFAMINIFVFLQVYRTFWIIL